jgi:hypothetical protein
MPTDLTNQPLSSFEGAAARTEAQKAAVLASIAQSGTAGVQQYQQAQAQTNDLRGQAINSALGAAQTSPLSTIPGGVNQVTAPIEQNFAMRQADLAQGQATFGQDIERQKAGNEGFFGQMQQALPVVENHTKVAIQQILAQQEEAKQQRDLQRQLGEMQLQEAQMRASQAAAGPQDTRTPEEVEYAQLRNQGLRQDITAQDNETTQAADDARKAQVDQKAAALLKGKYADAKESQSYQAFIGLANGTLTLPQAQKLYRTPGGKPLNWDYIMNLVNEFQGTPASGGSRLLSVGT